LIPRRTLGLGEQLAYLRLHWPNFRSQVRGGVLFSRGALQPTPISNSYTIQATLPGGSSPDVVVIEPKLQTRDAEEPIPHMYSQERLCLYLPGSNEWRPDYPIALTILPWASLWLYFYEIWHSTGEWLGGGVHPEIPISSRRESRARLH
jgi:hypothetical protein